MCDHLRYGVERRRGAGFEAQTATTLRAASLHTRYLHKSPDVWRRLHPLIEELLSSPAA
jgi:hypothetical protein